MFLHSKKYSNYYLKKGASNRLEMYRVGKSTPLKPLFCKNSIKYALSLNGERVVVSLVDFLKSCSCFSKINKELVK